MNVRNYVSCQNCIYNIIERYISFFITLLKIWKTFLRWFFFMEINCFENNFGWIVLICSENIFGKFVFGKKTFWKTVTQSSHTRRFYRFLINFICMAASEIFFTNANSFEINDLKVRVKRFSNGLLSFIAFSAWNVVL